jgi:hypothetical protein
MVTLNGNSLSKMDKWTLPGVQRTDKDYPDRRRRGVRQPVFAGDLLLVASTDKGMSAYALPGERPRSTGLLRWFATDRQQA